jgi:hypothetical protein
MLALARALMQAADFGRHPKASKGGKPRTGKGAGAGAADLGDLAVG